MGRARRERFALALALSISGGCYRGADRGLGADGDDTEGETDGQDEPAPEEAVELPPTTAIPRLARREIEQTIVDVFGIEGAAERYLPEDPRLAVNPQTGAIDEAFDTFDSTKDPSAVFVEGLEGMAVEVAREFSADPDRVAAIAGCSPAGGFDPDCLRSLVEGLGLRLWRRPLTAEEVDALVAAATPLGQDGGHDFAVRMVAQSLLQSPQFAYHDEVGEDAGGGLRRLDNYQLVSRLSFFLWGGGPSAALLEAAGGDDLDDEALLALAESAMGDPRAAAQMRTFHRLWLRYDGLLVTDSQLAADMRAESDALVDRVLTETDSPWSMLFTADETYVTPALAEHYGLGDVPAQAQWVAYGDDGRAGLLSHGSFLSLSSTRGTETLPSRRGAMLAQRILCTTILPPPPDVDVDDGVEVEEGACKADAYEAHRQSGTLCASCHELIDPIGEGFERYDGLGRYRDTEQENPSCSIPGEGSFGGMSFAGPRQFATLVDEQGLVARCGVQQLGRFAFRGTADRSDFVDRLTTSFEESDQDFRALMLAFVTDPTFRYRREQTP